MAQITLPIILFFSFSFLLIGSAFGVVLHKNPLKSALFLIIFFISLALIYALLGLQLLATIQVLVYVGAIMVLFLFVIMFMSLREDYLDLVGINWSVFLIGCSLIGAFIIQFGILLFVTVTNKAAQVIDITRPYQKKVGETLTINGNTEVVSYEIFTKYLLPFEVVSIVLLIAVIGATMLAKKNNRKISE